MAALLSSNPKACISSRNSLTSQSISLASSFSGKPFVARVPRAVSSRSSPSKRRSFVVRDSELPLVGNTAPDFEAEAVFDQEFIKVKLSEYIGKKYVILGNKQMPSAVTAAAIPIPSISRPKHIHLPSHSAAKSPTISIKPLENEIPPVVSSSSPSEDKSHIQELLLYLDSLGVDSFYCLHSHPPLISTPLSQIKSTVDFLFSLGVTTQDLRRIFPMCPELLTSSTTVTVIPATTFLLREARVKAADLRYVIHRRPRLLTCSVDRQLRPTLYFLQGTIGIDHVGKWAPLLSCSVEDKFIPRIEYLQKLGFPYRDTITMFRRFPALFCYSIKENIKPKFDYFVAEMGRELKELVAFPQYFSFSLENRIKPRHRMCEDKGICLALPTMLKLSDARFRERLEVCCSSSVPVRTSPLWCTSTKTDGDNVT